MNKIVLRGFLRDIEYSHTIGDIEYEKANIICPNSGNKDDDIISIRYKKFSNKYKEGDFIELEGNLRSYSTKLDGKNNVQIYVFTYFDVPEIVPIVNSNIDGRICKKKDLKITKSGKQVLHFILANNIYTNSGIKINNYIPCVCYDTLAETVANMDIGNIISVSGGLHSHCFKKINSDGTFEYRIAHEISVKTLE